MPESTRIEYTPIPDYVAGMASRELQNLGKNENCLPTDEIMRELISHSDGIPTHIANTLQWAIQIHEVDKLPMNLCIEAAMIFYFG